MRHLLACTCLTPLALLTATGPVLAERVVDARITTPLRTSTAGTAGAADDIKLTDKGVIELESGTAITIDSDHDVRNEGNILIEDANDATGILAMPGRQGNILNIGRIRILEDYTPADGDKDGDLDGPFAQGARRYGIRVAPGGTFTGTIEHRGIIEIEGNDSAGLALDSRLDGDLISSGTISMVGDDSQGIRAGDVSGDVTVRGAVTVRGENSVAMDLSGDIGGALLVQGTLLATGYRAATPPSDLSKLDADDLLQGGPALRIAGNVAGGVHFAIAPPNKDDKDNDEDDDGVEDAVEGNASIISYGEAAAVEIGDAQQDIVIGAVAGQAGGHGLVIDGAIGGHGNYPGIDGNGLVIGGLGGAVDITGGMSVAGTITAASRDSNATAVRIGDGARVPRISVSGVVQASAGKDQGDLARAILIEQGAEVTEIRNRGRIEAAAGEKGTSEAIVDLSGRIGLVENSGAIIASGGGGAVAIDLSANDGGSVVRQVAATGTNPLAPRIVGDLRFGSGDDLLDMQAGSVAGRASFGTGADRLVLGGNASFTGIADFGGGADRLEIGGGTSRFVGNLVNSTGLQVVVAGGTFHATQLGSVDLGSLDMSAGGTLGVDIDGGAGTHTRYQVAGAAAFGQDTQIGVRLFSIRDSEGRYVVLSADTLTGAGQIGFDADTLPFLFDGKVETSGNDVAVVIERKSATELGLNRSSASAYDAIFAALDLDQDIAGVFLGIEDAEGLRAQFRQMLPDHAGGVFETVTLGSRATARFLADPMPPLADLGEGWGLWLQQVGWGTSKDIGDTASYDVTGWGASAGIERATGLGSFGLSVAYLAGEDADGENDNQVTTTQYELAGYWRGQFGGFRAFARGSAAMIDLDGTRYFSGLGESGNPVLRTARGEWNGQLYSLAAGLSYEIRAGRLSFRPAAAVDYYRLSEDSYSETEGGDGMNLIVEDRTSDELAASFTLTAGYDFGSREPGEMWLRAEAEGGRRQLLSGNLGSTVARFDDGDPFTLDPEQRTDGWSGALRLIGGTGGTVVAGEVMGEEQNGRTSIAGRLSVRLGF